MVLVSSVRKDVRKLSTASYGRPCGLQNSPEWRKYIAMKKTVDSRRAFPVLSGHAKIYKLCNSGSDVSSVMYTVKETCTAYRITQNLIKHGRQH